MLREAGFTDVAIHTVEGDAFNYYVARSMGSRLTNQTSSPTVASPRAAALGCRAGEDTLLVSTDSWFHRPAWIPEVVVKSAKFHSVRRRRPQCGRNPMFMPRYSTRYSSLPGLGYDRVQAGIRVGARRGGR